MRFDTSPQVEPVNFGFFGGRAFDRAVIQAFEESQTFTLESQSGTKPEVENKIRIQQKSERSKGTVTESEA